MSISQDEWDVLPQEEKNRRIHEFKRSLRHILEGHGKEVVVAALKSILEDMAEGETLVGKAGGAGGAVIEFKHGPEKIRDKQIR